MRATRNWSGVFLPVSATSDAVNQLLLPLPLSPITITCSNSVSGLSKSPSAVLPMGVINLLAGIADKSRSILVSNLGAAMPGARVARALREAGTWLSETM